MRPTSWAVSGRLTVPELGCGSGGGGWSAGAVLDVGEARTPEGGSRRAARGRGPCSVGSRCPGWSCGSGGGGGWPVGAVLDLRRPGRPRRIRACGLTSWAVSGRLAASGRAVAQVVTPVGRPVRSSMCGARAPGRRGARPSTDAGPVAERMVRRDLHQDDRRAVRVGGPHLDQAPRLPHRGPDDLDTARPQFLARRCHVLDLQPQARARARPGRRTGRTAPGSRHREVDRCRARDRYRTRGRRRGGFTLAVEGAGSVRGRWAGLVIRLLSTCTIAGGAQRQGYPHRWLQPRPRSETLPEDTPATGLTFRDATDADVDALVAPGRRSAYRGTAAGPGDLTEADFLAGQRTDPEGVLEVIKGPESRLLTVERDLADRRLLPAGTPRRSRLLRHVRGHAHAAGHRPRQDRHGGRRERLARRGPGGHRDADGGDQHAGGP